MLSTLYETEPEYDRDGDSRASSETAELIRPSQLHARAQQLRHVALRMEAFLRDQLARLEATMPDGVVEPGQLDFAESDAEFEAMRSRWENERQEQIRQLRDEAQRLDEAWQRLEVEQRQVMARQAAMKTVGATSNTNTGFARPAGPLHPVVTPRATVAAAAGPRLVEASGATASQQAQVQFQQLRREMQRHANQQKKGS